jgi:hypothetical protein
MRASAPAAPLILAVAVLMEHGCAAASAPPELGTVAESGAAPWREAEATTLRNHVQLTFADRFLRAGEAYFSPDGTHIVFQAIDAPAPGAEPEPFYQMYVADLVRDAGGRVTGIDGIRRLSPPGSANTCGWFHPTDPNRVIFGSTIIPPSDPKAFGYQRKGGDYAWFFPKEMDVVTCDLRTADGSASSLQRIVEHPGAYLAECAMSPSGRFLVYCEHVVAEGRSGGDLKVLDLATQRTVSLTAQSGYDGGPFFSPDGLRLCYRSDRRGNDLLQIFVGELAFDSAGAITGIAREFQLTDNAHVNWAPFWHPSGRHLIYTTSQMGHHNYEVFVLDADPGDVDAGRPTRYGTRMRRITFADGFDGLPVFDASGTLVMWTAQRDAAPTSQLWLAELAIDLDGGEAPREESVEPRDVAPSELHVLDPETGHYYVYDRQTHELSAYDPKTHEKRPVTDAAEKEKAMRLLREKGGAPASAPSRR